VVNQQAVNGMLYNGNATLRPRATDLFSALNNAGFLDAVYHDVLFRPVDPVGLSSWLPQLQSGNMTPAQVALSIIDGAGSTEYLQHLVTGSYSQYLRRDASKDTAGRDGWVRAMQGPPDSNGNLAALQGLTDAQVIAAILGDQTAGEYFIDL
jgi:hypothetical protein